jgi:hypothetical protein
MKLPEYVTVPEVQRVCREMGLRDWTEPGPAEVTLDEARIVQREVGGEALEISPEAFRDGLIVELEHGRQFPDANVTNNHPVLTGRIVLAHLKEMLDYYARLEIAELEGGLLRAALAEDTAKLADKYAKLLQARYRLSHHEVEAAAAP